MKIITKLAIEYIKKNKKRNLSIIMRNMHNNYINSDSVYTYFEFSRIYDKYSKK